MAESKTRKFYYKRASFAKLLPAADATLESLLRAAIKKKPKALQRKHGGDGRGDFHFLNYSSAVRSDLGLPQALCCEFLGFEEGADQSTIRLDAAAEIVDVDAVTAGTGEEFLAGALYFLVSKNHVVLAPSRGFGPRDLEIYLNWFLGELTRVLDRENRVELCDHIPAKKARLYTGVKKIRLGETVAFQPSLPSSPDDQVTKEGVERRVVYRADGRLLRALREFFADGLDLPSELTAESATEVPRIEAELTLTWKRERSGGDELDFMNSIARNLRHLDGGVSYAIQTNAGEVTSETVKIFHSQSVPWRKGRPVFESIFPKMGGWLSGLIDDHKVDP